MYASTPQTGAPVASAALTNEQILAALGLAHDLQHPRTDRNSKRRCHPNEKRCEYVTDDKPSWWEGIV